MGCDGGTIPRRDELVRTKKKPEQKDKNAETVAKWKHCALSQNPLHKPVVACELGKLYNKEAVIEHLLSKEKATSDVAGHISKLSDVKELSLTEKPESETKPGNSSQKGDEYVDYCESRYICPVTGMEMNGKQRFYFFWKCGCVISERAIKEVKSEVCHKCGKSFEDKDVIVINGTDEEIENLKDRMTERRRLSKLEKKKRKAELKETVKKIKVESDESNSDSNSGNASQLSNGNKIKTEIKEPDNKVKVESDESNSDSSSVSGSKMKNGKIKSATNGRVNPKMLELPEKAQKNYSIAKDPSASAAYKSLFTSSSKAKKQDKPHWITHNPLYY